MDVQLILVCLFILPPCPAALVKGTFQKFIVAQISKYLHLLKLQRVFSFYVLFVGDGRGEEMKTNWYIHILHISYIIMYSVRGGGTLRPIFCLFTMCI